jgi:hypothetical protein
VCVYSISCRTGVDWRGPNSSPPPVVTSPKQTSTKSHRDYRHHEATIPKPTETMAKSPLPFTWKNGFRQPSSKHHWESSILNEKDHDPDQADYVTPPSLDLLTSTVHNSLGLNILRTWPTLYNGTNSPHGLPSWWKPSSEVDVLICGGTQLSMRYRV